MKKIMKAMQTLRSRGYDEHEIKNWLKKEGLKVPEIKRISRDQK